MKIRKEFDKKLKEEQEKPSTTTKATLAVDPLRVNSAWRFKPRGPARLKMKKVKPPPSVLPTTPFAVAHPSSPVVSQSEEALRAAEKSLGNRLKWSSATLKRQSRVRPSWSLSKKVLKLLRKSPYPLLAPPTHPSRHLSPGALMRELEREYIEKLSQQYPNRSIEPFQAGDRIKITKRLSLDPSAPNKFEEITGMCIARKGRSINKSFIILNRCLDVDYELHFPLYSPFITKIQVMERTIHRRSKLYFLRDRPPKEYIT